MKKYIFTIFLLVFFASHLECQRLSDQLQGDLLQTGEIILKQVKKNTTLDIIYQQKITQEDYNVVLSLKRVEYQRLCKGQYKFGMKVLIKQEDKFVLNIQNYNCLRRVEVQWFAHTYQANSVNETAYFREQVYQKNMVIRGNKTISQEYIFDIKMKNRDILPLFTGFQLYPNTKIELIINRVFDRTTSKFINTNLNIYDNSQTQNITSKQMQFTMSFLIAHPNLFNCQKGLNISDHLGENALVLQNIEYLDTSEGSQEGEKLVCYFKQYNSSSDQLLQSKYTPLINPIQYYINGTFSNKDIEVNEDENNEDEDEKQNQKNKNENEKENGVENNSQENTKLNNDDNNLELFQIIFVVLSILTILSAIVYKIFKENQKSESQSIYAQNNPSYQIPAHVQLQEDL
ncbi:hypothetical protein ABPG74_013777 [Tetrahymena malaccensis]